MKSALITGITGQDGAYLAEFLLNKGYRVYGAYRRTSSENFWRIQELGIVNHPELKLLEFDLCDFPSGLNLIEKCMPDEVYNLASQSFVQASFTHPVSTTYATGLGPLNLLEAIRKVNLKIKFYQASSSEMFGKAQEIPQTEKTPFYPRSPYGVSKLYGHWITVNYRESYDIFAVSGILFNHESPLRGKEFVTRKITDSVAKISLGKQSMLELGNLDARRDWGYAKEYIVGMYLMMQAQIPDSYVLATQRTNTVRDFVTLAFQAIDCHIEWRGSGKNEAGFDAKTGDQRVRINPAFYRPSEVDMLLGNPSKAKKELGWQSKTTCEELCALMVEQDIKRNLIAEKS